MTIVSSDAPVTVVGGAGLDRSDLNTALRLAPTLVAVDGGADAVLIAGMTPVAVIGDMDSLGPIASARLADRLHRISEQESTDFDKALRHVTAPLVLALGVTGGRFDHELAMVHVLLCHPDRRCIAIGAQSITFLCPPDLSLDLAPGTVLSLFPMAPVGTRSKGLRWPTDGLRFAPDGRIGTSNEVTGPVRLTPDGPYMLVILPKDTLDVVVKALLDREACEQWSARG